jgi:hypothetical protein
MDEIASPGAALIFVRKLFKLCSCKYRAILADIIFSYIAPAAFSETAFHPVLKCCIDVFIREAKFGKHRESIFYHYRWAADYCYCVL